VSVAGCELIGLMQVAGETGKCSHQCYFTVRRSGSGKFLTGAGEREKGNCLYEQSERRGKRGKTVKCLVDK
jgi:hypothetical protein